MWIMTNSFQAHRISDYVQVESITLVRQMSPWLVFLFCLSFPLASFACTAFYATNDSLVLAAKNLDSDDPHTRITFMPAPEGGNGWMFHSKGNGFPQGGMNEQGLFWEGASTPYRDFQNPETNRKQYTGTHIMQKVMEECSTVSEAIDIFSEYYFLDLLDAQYLIGDRFGYAAVIEGEKITRISGNNQIITNFNHSDFEDATCVRYKTVQQMLSSEELSLDLMKQALSATHQEQENATTLYSVIYNLNTLTAQVYHFHDFGNAVVLDLAEELSDGARTIELPSLFPPSFAATQYMQLYDARQANKYKMPVIILVLCVLVLAIPLVSWASLLLQRQTHEGQPHVTPSITSPKRSTFGKCWLLFFALFGIVTCIIYIDRARLIEDFLNAGGIISTNAGDIAITWALTIGTAGLLALPFLVWRMPNWNALTKALLCMCAAVYCILLYVLNSMTLLLWS